MAEASTKPAGKGGLVITLGALTVIACVGGGLVGKLMVARLHATSTAPASQEASKGPTYGEDIEVHELPAIITNLGEPATMRVRLQVSIVYPKKGVENAAVLMAEVGEDLVAFMKTVSLGQIEGASGLHNLSEDLNDRAATRSQGKVREVIIETLVMQ